VDGPRIYTKLTPLADTPAFVRAGAVLPTRTNASSRLAVSSPLVWWMFPGAVSGGAEVYEDDGATMNYTRGQHATTLMNYSHTDDTATTTFHIGAVSLQSSAGSAEQAWFPKRRQHWVVMWGIAVPPSRVTCDGVVVYKGSKGTPGTFWLLPQVGTGGMQLPTLTVACEDQPVSQDLTVVVTLPSRPL